MNTGASTRQQLLRQNGPADQRGFVAEAGQLDK